MELISREAALAAISDDKGIQYPGWWYKDRIRSVPGAQRWIPVSEGLPEEDHWLGGSGRQFSDTVLISILNSNDEDAWVDISHTIDGEWALELPRYCQIVAWMPLPTAYKGVDE